MTSIEWLYNNLKSHFEHDGDLLEVVKMSFDQAKELHKKEIINAYYLGDYSDTRIAEKYYEQTFKNKIK